jgi:hypothetical protein
VTIRSRVSRRFEILFKGLGAPASRGALGSARNDWIFSQNQEFMALYLRP